MRHVFRRLTAPALIMLLLLSGGCPGKDPERDTGDAPKAPNGRVDVVLRGANWTMFRGTPEQTGTAPDELPPKLKRLWTYEAKTDIESTAAVVEDTVYIGTGNDRLLALDLASGKPKWTYKTEDSITSGICVHDGRVFFGDVGGTFHAVDAKTGEKIWTFASEGQIISSANISGDGVLFGSYDATLYCLEAATGKKKWTFQADAQVHASPCVFKGRVTIAGCDMMLRFISLKTGEEDASVALGSNVASSPAYFDGKVYVGTLDGTLRCVDVSRLAIAWEVAGENLGEVHASPAAGSWGAIFSTRGGTVIRISPDGKEKWRFSTKGANDSSPVVVGRRVFFGSGDGKLYALDLESGEPVWRFAAGSAISSSPAVGRERLVIAAEDGAIYCFGAK